MAPLSVVKHLQVVEQTCPGLIPGLVIAMHDQLALERMEEAFHWCIVPAIFFATHALPDGVPAKQCPTHRVDVITVPMDFDERVFHLDSRAK